MSNALANIASHLKPRSVEGSPELAHVKTRLPFEALAAFLDAHGVNVLAFEEGSYYRRAVVYAAEFTEKTGLRVETGAERKARHQRTAEAIEAAQALCTLAIAGEDGEVVTVHATSPLAFLPGSRMLGVPHLMRKVN